MLILKIALQKAAFYAGFVQKYIVCPEREGFNYILMYLNTDLMSFSDTQQTISKDATIGHRRMGNRFILKLTSFGM